MITSYLNRVRSSRRLEVECGRNIELMWLTGCQVPSYHTISDFRSIKPHRKALKATFRLFNQLLDGAGLFGKTRGAIDGTKIRAQNSKKNNISEEKILKRLDYPESLQYPNRRRRSALLGDSFFGGKYPGRAFVKQNRHRRPNGTGGKKPGSARR